MWGLWGDVRVACDSRPGSHGIDDPVRGSVRDVWEALGLDPVRGSVWEVYGGCGASTR